MAGIHEVKCSVCDYSRHIRLSGRVYIFSDGERGIDQGFCWCHNCGTVTACELFPRLESVERLLAEAKADNAETVVIDLIHLINWLKTRVSQPRCLECGTTMVCQFICLNLPYEWSEPDHDHDFADLPHPGCQGMLHVRFIGLSLERGSAQRYSPEGERLDDA